MSERRDRIFLTRRIQQQPGLLAPDARERPWRVWRGGMDMPLHGSIVECILHSVQNTTSLQVDGASTVDGC